MFKNCESFCFSFWLCKPPTEHVVRHQPGCIKEEQGQWQLGHRWLVMADGHSQVHIETSSHCLAVHFAVEGLSVEPSSVFKSLSRCIGKIQSEYNPEANSIFFDGCMVVACIGLHQAFHAPRNFRTNGRSCPVKCVQIHKHQSFKAKKGRKTEQSIHYVAGSHIIFEVPIDLNLLTKIGSLE